MPVRQEALWTIALEMADLATALALALQEAGHTDLAARALKQAEDARDALTKEAIRAQIQPERIGSSMPSFVCKSSDS
jgi:hypothetical protein